MKKYGVICMVLVIALSFTFAKDFKVAYFDSFAHSIDEAKVCNDRFIT